MSVLLGFQIKAHAWIIET